MKHSILLLSALSTIMAGCSDHHDTLVDDWAETRAVRLALPIAGSNVSSENLRVLFFDATGMQFIASPDQMSADTTGSGQFNKIHMTLLPASKAISEGRIQGRLVVLADCPQVSDSPTATELVGLTYSDISHGIPMYGALNLDAELIESYEINCDPIQMLRSTALVTVKLSDNLIAQGIRLESCTIPQEINTTGYCLPSNTLAITREDYQDENVFRPLSTSQVAGTPFATADGGKSMELMMPEMANDGTLSMQVSFLLDNTPLTGSFAKTLYFQNYTTSTPMNVIRNHHYVFTITGLTSEVDGMTVEVMDWNQQVPETIVFN